MAAISLPLVSTTIAPAVAAGTDFDVSGSSEGGVGCAGFIDPPACDQWRVDRPPGSTSWPLIEHREASGVYAETADIHLNAEESQAADGHFQSATLHAQLKATDHGGGEGHATATYDLAIETSGDYALSVSASGGMTAVGDTSLISRAQIQLHLECGEQAYDQQRESVAGTNASKNDSDGFNASATVEASEGETGCHATINLYASSSTNGPAKDESGSVQLTLDATIAVAGAAPSPGACDGVRGSAKDGAEGSSHANALAGVRVQLYRDGSPRGGPVATGHDGTFCIHRGNGVDPGAYKVRATLIDESRHPPLFETRYQDASEAEWVEQPVTLEASGASADTVVAFANDAARPWLSDVADIHWQAARFVDWLTGPLGYQPQTLGAFTIRTFDAGPNGTAYTPSDKVLHIAVGDSPYANRDDPNDSFPENGEWHEIGHSVAYALGIAASKLPVCVPFINHAGWLNSSTCDSLSEGFPAFLATLGSLVIEADRPAYVDTWYASIANLESQWYRPWSAACCNAAGAWIYREDFAVSQLLWDIADAQADAGEVYLTGDPAPHPLVDKVAIGGPQLIDILAAQQVNTVADLYRALRSGAPPGATTPSVDLDGDGTDETSDLDQVFLMHGFYPVTDLTAPAYTLGDHVSRTDHITLASGGLVVREHTPELANSNVRLQNGTPESVTFTVDVTGLEEAWHDEIAVAAGTQRDLYVELPPYYRQALGPEPSLPSCGADATAVTLTIAAPGAAPKSMSSCDYAHAIATSTDGAGLTYKVGTGPVAAPSAGPSTPAEPTPAPGLEAAVVALIAAVVVIGLLAVGYVGRRRTRRS